MRAFLLCLALTFPALVFAQGAPHGGGSSGVTIATGIGASPSAAGMTLSAGKLTLQPADATHPGIVTTGQQSISGQKDFQTHISVPSGSNVILDGSAGTHSISWNSGSSQMVINAPLGTSGLGNGASSPATQGVQFSGNNTFLNCSGAACNVKIGNSAGTSYVTLDVNNKGTITLSGGTGTHTVSTGCIPVCTDTTANASVKCAVSTTTLTATGTGTDVIAYLCF